MDQSTNDRSGRLRPLARLCRDERGNLTIFGVIGFGMLMVVIGLVIDVGRVMNMHSESGSYADRVALAAAAELDGRLISGKPRPIARAMAAALGDEGAGIAPQVAPGRRLSLSNDRDVGVARLVFMSDIGPDPADPFARSPVAGDVVTAEWVLGEGLTYNLSEETANRTTRYVLVETTRESEDFIFFPLLRGLSPDMESSATVAPQALAGFKREMCNTPPVMLCSMNEQVAGVGADFSPVRGQMIRARVQSGSDWRPGDIGVRQSSGGTGSFALSRNFGRISPNTTCVGDTLRLERNQPSNLRRIADGLNTRLDMYDGWMALVRNHSQYPPSENVLKGLRTQGFNCSNPKSSTSTPLPRDNCFMPGGSWPNGVGGSAGSGCINVSGSPRAGNTQWDRWNYWTTNHSGDPPPPGYSSMTRYQVYRYEIEHAPPDVANTPQESGSPTCSASTPISSFSRDRRVLPVAIVNCLEHQSVLLDSNRDVPVEDFAEVFLTEPAGNNQWWGGSQNDLYIEMIGRIRTSTPEANLREYSVLYR